MDKNEVFKDAWSLRDELAVVNIILQLSNCGQEFGTLNINATAEEIM